jgi:hypothetical protein
MLSKSGACDFVVKLNEFHQSGPSYMAAPGGGGTARRLPSHEFWGTVNKKRKVLIPQNNFFLSYILLSISNLESVRTNCSYD